MKSFSLFMAFYFGLGACIPSCDFSQLMKLDDLMEHYKEHQEEARANQESISFSSFLYDHFIDHHENESEHEDLPFHNFSSSVTFYLALFQTNHSYSPDFNQIKLILHKTFFQEVVTFDIFHPPIIA